ncbi:MAG: GNAT family N-acetyltransferase [Thermoproteota archaeon]
MARAYGEFVLEDGSKVVLRSPRWEDLDSLTEFINSLVEEGAPIARDKKVTREEEVEWLAGRLADIEKGQTIMIVAEIKSKVIGNSEINRLRGYQNHVGLLGIAVAREYRNRGIGTKMLETLIEESMRTGLKLLVLDVLSTNTKARHVYNKVGFKEAGAVPKMARIKEGYDDVIRMYLEL